MEKEDVERRRRRTRVQKEGVESKRRMREQKEDVERRRVEKEGNKQ